MIDIREQILKATFDKHEHRMLDYPQINSKGGVLDAMDEYAIKVLRYAKFDDDFLRGNIPDMNKYLEEIKTELND